VGGVNLKLILDLIEAADVLAEIALDVSNDIGDMLKLFRPVWSRLRQGQPVQGNLTGKALPVRLLGAAEDFDVASMTLAESR